MKINFNLIKQKKLKEKENTKLVEGILKDYLSDYFEIVEFDYNFGRDGFTFLAKEVEFRKDLLQKIGIPLELSIGKIKFIKFSVKSLIKLKNFSVEISDIDIEVQTIHISKDYKKNYLNYRQKFLNEWESKHKKFFNSMAKPSILEEFVVNRLIPIKIEIKNVNIKLNDSISSQDDIKQIELRIDSIHSLGCNEKWEIIEEQENDKLVYRTLETQNVSVSINQIKNYETIFLGSLLNEFNMNAKLTALRTYKNYSLRVVPKINLEIAFLSPLIINFSVPNIKILQNLLSYLMKIKKVEKYWVNRPEFKEEGKINKSDAMKWFLYAFRVLREEIRNNKRQNYELSTLIEKIISMEKYIQYYKESHKLIIAPWIHQKDHKVELQTLENKMPLEDIIYCRELAFAELLTEGRAFCASGEVGEGYKPFVHLWEFYVNDLRTKWMNKEEPEPTTIKLSDKERRQLMTIWKNDRDMVLLSYIKGEPNHPKDILLKFNLNINLLMINFSRNIPITKNCDIDNDSNPDQLSELNKIYASIYNKQIQSKLKYSLNFSSVANSMKRDQIEKFLSTDIKTDDNNDSDDEAVQLDLTIHSKSHNHESKGNYISSNHSNNDCKEEKSCIYIDEISINAKKLTENDNHDTSIKHLERHMLTRKSNDKIPILSNGKLKPKHITKTILSFVIFDTIINYLNKRNDECDIKVKISTLSFIDHNCNYVDIKKNKNHCLSKVFLTTVFNEDKRHNEVFNNKNKKASNSFHENMILFFIDILREPSFRNLLLHQGFKNELNFLNQYEENFGFKKCEVQGQGYQSLNEHFSRIVIDYLMQKEVFESLYNQMLEILNEKYRKKYEKMVVEEKKELLKRMILKQFSDLINPYQKPLYERTIQENYIKTMIEDLNTIFRIVCIQLIQHIISSFYSYHISESNISRCLSMHIKSISENENNDFHHNDKNQANHYNDSHIKTHQFNNKYLIKAEYFTKGRDYPNYIMQNEMDFVENSNPYDKENPDTSINVKVNTHLTFRITNELLAELALLLPEITTGEKETYAGNILNDLTRSHLKIFDDFRQLRAKWGVLNDLKRKKAANDHNTPIEVIYLQNLTKHLNELTKNNYLILCELKQLSIKVYDKMYFLEKNDISSFSINFFDITLKNSNLKKFKKEIHIDLPSNYDLNTICRLLFYSKLRIESIQISIDKNEPIFHTDINIYNIYSLMNNTLFIPDNILEIYSNKLIINIYPCIIKMSKNFEHLMLYKAIFSSEEMKNESNESAFIIVNKSIFKNNLARFVRNLNTILHERCSKDNYQDKQSQINNLEYYLEKRLNKIITYSIGNIEDKNKGIVLNFFREDSNFEIRKFDKEFENRKSEPKTVLNKSFNKNTYKSTIKDDMKLIQPFFSLKCDLMIYNSLETLFYQDDQIWLCPFYTKNSSLFEKIVIELQKGSHYTFSTYEYIMFPFFIRALTPENIIQSKINNDFPFDKRFEVQNLKLNCIYKKTSFYYEDENELRLLYLEHFKEKINETTSTYLSNIKLIINKINFKAYFENNQDLIETFFNVTYYQNLYQNEPLTRPLRYIRDLEALESKNNIKNSQRNKKEYYHNTRKITIHVITFLIKQISIKLYYRFKNYAQDNLSLIVTIKSIQYNENNLNKRISSLNDEIARGKASIDSFLVVLSIPKNFENISDFDADDRVPLWERSYMKQILNEIRLETATDGERIVLLIRHCSLKLTNQDQVVFEIFNAIQFGFTNQKGTIRESNLIIIEDIFWIFPYENGTNKQKEMILEKGKEIISVLNTIDTSYDKCIEIIFLKLFVQEKDPKLTLFNPITPFSNFQKMIYIIKSTIAYEMIYKAIIKTNLVSLDLPNRLYYYLYYINNWEKEISRMIRKLNKQTNHIVKTRSLKEEDTLSDYVLQDLNLPYNDETAEIFSFFIPQLFLTFKQHNVAYSQFIYLNSKGQIILNSNNEKVFSFSSVDMNWKVLDSKCNNLIIKKNPKDIMKKIFEISVLLNTDNTLSKESKIKHKFLINFSDLEIVYLQKYVIEVLNYFDWNEICLREFPLKTNLNKLFPAKKSDIEEYYYVLNNFSIILPEDSNSSNYIKFSCIAGTVQTNRLIDIIPLVVLPENKKDFLIIDKDSIFGIQPIFNFDLNQFDQYLSPNSEHLFCLTKHTAEFIAVDSYLFLNGKKEQFLTADNILLIFKSPKSEDPLTKVYQYLWKELKKKIIRLKSTFNINIKHGKLRISLGNFFAVDKFLDNNFDEESSLFPEINNVFKLMEYDIQFENEGEIGVDIFKAFSNFFEKSYPIEKIGNTLPGHNNKIDYDTIL